MRTTLVLALAFLGLLLYLCLCPARVDASGIGRFLFVDIAAETGMDVHNVCGDSGRRWYIPESNGNGAAWLDCDDVSDRIRIEF